VPKSGPGEVQRNGWIQYNYLDEEGHLLYQVVRKQPKGFFQRRRVDGIGGWVNALTAGTYVKTGRSWSKRSSGPEDGQESQQLDDVPRRVLYRLPEIMDMQTVVLVEGEKDVDNLQKWDVPATTNAQGSKSWKPEYGYEETLRDKVVHLIPDNDVPGVTHMVTVAMALQGIADLIYLHRPLGGEIGSGFDVSDWIEEGHTEGQLAALMRNVAPFDPSEPPSWLNHYKKRSRKKDSSLFNQSKGGGPERQLQEGEDPVERILVELGNRGSKIEVHGDYWMAQCPAHDDGRPSLKVSRGEGGKATVMCYAGCEADHILAQLGLSMRDLYVEDRGVRSDDRTRGSNQRPSSSAQPEKPASLADVTAIMEDIYPTAATERRLPAVDKALGVVLRLNRMEQAEALNLIVARSGAGKNDLKARMREIAERENTSPSDKVEDLTDTQSLNGLGSLAERVNTLLNMPRKGMPMRMMQQEASGLVCRYFDEHGWLLCDDSSRPSGAFVLTDEHEALPVMGNSQHLRVLINRVGVNASENAFKHLIHELETACIRQGKRVVLARWSTWKDGRLFVSNGSRQMVVASLEGSKVKMEALPNGEEGVLFDGTAVFPEWELLHPDDMIDPRDVGALKPALTNPPEILRYDDSMQGTLLTGWLVAIMANIRPLPVLLAMGDADSGKTTLLRLLLHLLQGATFDVASMSRNEHDWAVSVSRKALHVLDNADERPPDWFPDSLATTVTGGMLETRRLYSDDDLVQLRATAAVAISSRTAAFARRPDVLSRMLPLFFGDMPAVQRRSTRELAEEVRAARDGVMTWLVYQALRGQVVGRSRAQAAKTSGVDLSRYDEFAETVLGLESEDGLAAIMEMQRAQAISIVDMDKLVAAVRGVFDNDKQLIQFEKKPGELPKFLEHNQGEIKLPPLGGAKNISNRIRELSKAFELVGIQVDPLPDGNTTVFRFIDRHKARQSGLKIEETQTSSSRGQNIPGGNGET